MTIGCKGTRGAEGRGEGVEDATGISVSVVLEEADDRVCTCKDQENK